MPERNIFDEAVGRVIQTAKGMKDLPPLAFTPVGMERVEDAAMWRRRYENATPAVRRAMLESLGRDRKEQMMEAAKRLGGKGT